MSKCAYEALSGVRTSPEVCFSLPELQDVQAFTGSEQAVAQELEWGPRALEVFGQADLKPIQGLNK